MAAPSHNLLPEGLEDRLTDASMAAVRVTRAAMDTFDRHGYDRVQPPSIEFEESLAARMPVHTRRMFRFTDPASLRTLALRADMTPQIGRIAATRLSAAPHPLRLAYAGQVLTIDGAHGASGLSPTRERLQLGAELIGSDGVGAAREVVAIALEALARAGAADVSIDFTLPDLLSHLPLGRGLAPESEQFRLIQAALDAKDAGALVASGGGALLHLLDAVGPFAPAIARLEAFDRDGALASRIAALRHIAEGLAATALTLDPTERHGFAYQSWFGFTLYGACGTGGRPLLLGRGGTYTIARGEGADPAREAATGVSLYPDGLIDALAAARAPRRVLFLPLGHDMAAAAALRDVGWRTIAALDAGDAPRPLGCTHILRGGEAVEI